MIVSREISIIFLSGSEMGWCFHYKRSLFVFFLKVTSLIPKLLLVIKITVELIHIVIFPILEDVKSTHTHT